VLFKKAVDRVNLAADHHVAVIAIVVLPDLSPSEPLVCLNTRSQKEEEVRRSQEELEEEIKEKTKEQRNLPN